MQVELPPGFIDLGLGDPQLELLPRGLIGKSALERLSHDDNTYLQYGANQGDGRFRLSLSGFLSRAYSFLVDPSSLFITSGVSMALHLLCTFLTHPGDAVFLEEPTYLYALRIFRDHELQLISIDTDEDGLILESLEANLARYKPKFLYFIPTFQNPTGHTLPQERRLRLLEIAHEHDLVLVADEVYHLLAYSTPPPSPFAAHLSEGKVISLGSFSKILAPGLRLGWLQANPDIIERFLLSGLLDSGGGLNPFTSALLQPMIDSGELEGNIASLISVYRSRLDVMDTALRREIPSLRYTRPGGGYFIWAHLPNGLMAHKLQVRAQSCQVGVRPGSLFSSHGGLEEFIRLCFVLYDKPDLEQGIQRLKLAIGS